MNLEKLNLVELNASEKKEIEGGWVWFVVGAIAGGILYDIVANPSNTATQFQNGYNAGYNYNN